MQHTTKFHRASAMVRALTLFVLAISIAGPAHAQLGKRLQDAAKRAAEREAARQVDKKVTEAIRCAVGEYECYERARAEGKEVVFIDEQGRVITDSDGRPVSDPAQAAGAGGAGRPGEGVWANYDFVPGERVLFADDLSRDRVGDFPRRLEFVKGNMEIVDWQGRRLLRSTDYGQFLIHLPQTLPERFTIEFDFNTGYFGLHENAVFLERYDRPVPYYEANYFSLAPRPGVTGKDVPQATVDTRRTEQEVVSVRIMVDGSYTKMYLNEQRIANVPNARLNRSDTLHFRFRGTLDKPSYIGNFRIAAGGRDLYEALSRDGRVSTQGIYFDTGSDRIRPESSGTLDEIARMLNEHPELHIRIEGHTDSVGDAAQNLRLSERRAESVRAALTSSYRVDPERMTAVGHGQEQPVDSNDTPEGRQNNRRVELVRI